MRSDRLVSISANSRSIYHSDRPGPIPVRHDDPRERMPRNSLLSLRQQPFTRHRLHRRGLLSSLEILNLDNVPAATLHSRESRLGSIQWIVK